MTVSLPKTVIINNNDRDKSQNLHNYTSTCPKKAFYFDLFKCVHGKGFCLCLEALVLQT